MTIQSLFVYPVKALGAVALSGARVSGRGLDADRRWMIVRPDGEFVSQRTIPALARVQTALRDGCIRLTAGSDSIDLPRSMQRNSESEVRSVEIFGDTVEAVQGPRNASAWITEVAGEELWFVHMDDTCVRRPDPQYSKSRDRVSFADGFPVLLTSTGSLNELNRHLSDPVPMDRFRPNIVVDAPGAWVEESWKTLEVCGVHFRVASTCGRCVVTTVDQATGRKGREPLRTLSRIHMLEGKAVFGVNLIPDEHGWIETGAPVRTLA